MYSTYNRSIPSPFENTLYCGTKQNSLSTEKSSEKQTASCNQNSVFLIAILFLFLADCSSS